MARTKSTSTYQPRAVPSPSQRSRPPPCGRKTKRVPPWIRERDNLPKGSTYTTSPQRYIVERDGDVPCVRAPPGSSQVGTRCYSEDNPRRAVCKLLVDKEEHQLPQGLHVLGVSKYLPPYGKLGRLVCEHSSVYSFERTKVDTRKMLYEPGSVLVLGPYKNYSGMWVTKCVSTEDMLEEKEQAYYNFQRYFTTLDFDTFVPTFKMIDECRLGLLGYRRNAEEEEGSNYHGKKTLTDLFDIMTEHLVVYRNHIFTRNNVVSILHPYFDRDRGWFIHHLRLIAKMLFFLCLYNMRWAGPNTPYQIRNDDTQRRVGSEGKPISSLLRRKYVKPSIKGPTLTKNKKYPPADFVGEEGRLDNMEYAHIFSLWQMYNYLIQEQEDMKHYMRSFFKTGVGAPFIDGTGFYPDRREDIFGVLKDIGLASSARGCVRANSRVIMEGVLSALHTLYPPQASSIPSWSRLPYPFRPNQLSSDDPSDAENRVTWMDHR